MAKEELSTLSRGLRILDYLANEDKGARFGVLCDALTIPSASLYRLLNTLMREGYVYKAFDRRYRVTPEIVRTGYIARRCLQLNHLADDHVSRLHDQLRTTVELSSRHHDGVMYIDLRPEPDFLQFAINAHPGVSPRQMHATAHGKIALAHISSEALSAYLQRKPLKKKTQETQTKPSEILNSIVTIRKQGFATEWKEAFEEVARVAAPIFDVRAIWTGCIGISLRTSDCTYRSLIEYYGPIVKESARTISNTLEIHEFSSEWHDR